MQQVFPASRGRIKHLAVRREIETPRVAGSRSHLFHRRAIRLETDDSGCDPAKRLCAIAGFRVAGTVPHGAVDPAIEAPAHVVDYRVGIPGAKSSIELFNFIRLAVTISVAQPKNIRRLFNDHTILVK